MAKSHPEHNLVAVPTYEDMLALGWSPDQIICDESPSGKGQWRVPKTPHDMSKRDAGRKFEGYPVDFALFDAPENRGDPDHLIAIFEFKAPTIDVGVRQLKTYMRHEPATMFGYWTNGTDSAAVYLLGDGTLSEPFAGASLPSPSDNIRLPSERALTYDSIEPEGPSTKRLTALFSSLLNTIAAQDAVSTRPEQRLNALANLLILKLESDKDGAAVPTDSLQFQIMSDPEHTAIRVNRFFDYCRRTKGDLFFEEEHARILFSDDTIHWVVSVLQRVNLGKVSPQALSVAFQVFRSANLKIGDGQYFTPMRVIEAGTRMLEVKRRDKVIDPACGTSGFLYKAFEEVREGVSLGADAASSASEWAARSLFGIDRDNINIKLSRALMVGIGDGSTNVIVGDSLREHLWGAQFPRLSTGVMEDESYTVVLTNPPFGKGLKVSALDARRNSYDIARHSAKGLPADACADTETGILFVERAWRLLQPGGRLGIVLPETYFFSKSYEWFRQWVEERFILRGILNIPMEAFQGFCRAKTNFYVFQKKGKAAPFLPVPSWFRDGFVWVSRAATIGINKDGEELYVVDERGERTNVIDDTALDDVGALLRGEDTATSGYVSLDDLPLAVPQYTDYSARSEFREALSRSLPDFSVQSLGEMVHNGKLKVLTGHGSPSSDVRGGNIPYIKVSDLRAGLVNENPTNTVSGSVARKYWKLQPDGQRASGLEPYDVITPARASSNIGEPCVLMPDQTEIVLTKEVLVFRPGPDALFDAHYLAWALDLDVVKSQWDRVVFMQTNRDDVGERWREVEIPIPPNPARAREVSSAYRARNLALARIREDFAKNRVRL